MSKQYIELTSTYRNRNVWSKTSEFEVDFARPNGSLETAYDPVSEQAPIKVWKSNNFDTDGGGASISVVVDSIGTGRKSIIVKDNTASNIKLQTTNDYYNGTMATLTSTPPPSTSTATTTTTSTTPSTT